MTQSGGKRWEGISPPPALHNKSRRTNSVRKYATSIRRSPIWNILVQSALSITSRPSGLLRIVQKDVTNWRLASADCVSGPSLRFVVQSPSNGSARVVWAHGPSSHPGARNLFLSLRCFPGCFLYCAGRTKLIVHAVVTLMAGVLKILITGFLPDGKGDLSTLFVRTP